MFKLFDYFSKLVIEADPRFYIASMKENKKISGLLSGENIEKAVSSAGYKAYLKSANQNNKIKNRLYRICDTALIFCLSCPGADLNKRLAEELVDAHCAKIAALA